MRLSTILSVPLLSAAVLAGPVAETNTSVPANTPDSSPEGLSNLVALFFAALGAPACSLGCLTRAVADTTTCTGILNIACFCNANSGFVNRVVTCAANVCSQADRTALLAVLQLGCSLVGAPIGGGGKTTLAPPAPIAAEHM